MPPPPLATYHSASYAVRAQILSLLALLPNVSFPVWWGALVDERHYTLVSFGLLNTAQMIGSLVAAIILIFTIERMNRSLVTCVLMVAVAATFIGVMLIRDINVIIVLFGLKGAASGAALAIATLYIGYTANPDRQYAIGVTLATLAQSAIVLVLTRVYEWAGNNGVQLMHAGILLAGAAIVLTLPRCMPDVKEQQDFVEGKSHADTSAAPALIWIAAVPVILATICFNTYNVNVFNYSERVGAERGIAIDMIGTVLSVTMLSGALGSLAAVWMGKRFGRIVPVVIGALFGAASTVLLVHAGTGVIGYAIGLTIFSIVWSLVQPYISAQTMAIDYSGRVVVISGPLVGLGGIATSAAVTALSAWYDIQGVLWFATSAILLCPLAMYAAVMLLRPEIAQPILDWLRRARLVRDRSGPLGAPQTEDQPG